MHGRPVARELVELASHRAARVVILQRQSDNRNEPLLLETSYRLWNFNNRTRQIEARHLRGHIGCMRSQIFSFQESPNGGVIGEMEAVPIEASRTARRA